MGPAVALDPLDRPLERRREVSAPAHHHAVEPEPRRGQPQLIGQLGGDMGGVDPGLGKRRLHEQRSVLAV